MTYFLNQTIVNSKMSKKSKICLKYIMLEYFKSEFQFTSYQNRLKAGIRFIYNFTTSATMTKQLMSIPNYTGYKAHDSLLNKIILIDLNSI